MHNKHTLCCYFLKKGQKGNEKNFLAEYTCTMSPISPNPTVCLSASGVEVAGTIHDVGNNIPNCNFTPGDKVILYPTDEVASSGYAEYLAIEDSCQIIQIPAEVPLEVAAMLPGCALSAYAAVLSAKPHVEKLSQVKCKCFMK